jgi:hypothetical protein
VTKSIFGTTQPAILVSSQIPMTQGHVILECTPSFTIAPSYHVTQMLNDQYSIMNLRILPKIIFYQPTLGTMDHPMQATTIFPTHGQ